MSTRPSSRAFTMIELLVSLGIIGVLVAVSVDSFSKSSRLQALEANASALAEGLRDARAETLASVGASQYGIKVDSDEFTFFKGATFSSSTPGNFSYPFPNTIHASSSLSSIVFARVTGSSSASGTIDVYLVTSPSTKKTVYVQSTGLVGIQ